MTRVVIKRGSSGSQSSSNQNRSAAASTSTSAPSTSTSSACPQQQGTDTTLEVPAVKEEKLVEVQQLDELSDKCAISDKKIEDISPGSLSNDQHEGDKAIEDETIQNDDTDVVGSVDLVGFSTQQVPDSSSQPPPPPPQSYWVDSTSRLVPSADPNSILMWPSRSASLSPCMSIRSSPTGSRSSSPWSYFEGEDYDSADEQNPCFSSSYNDAKREHQFETDLWRTKGWQVRKMLEDGNCLFRAVADQVFGDNELHDLVRQMCIDYMERERDHFSTFIEEGFTSYCKRKRRDKVYGNGVDIRAISEMYNRPVHIYSYRTEPTSTFHRNYHKDMPPIWLSFHRGNHFNSLVDPRMRSVGAGLGFSSLRGKTNIDKVKAAIKAQRDEQIDNALLAEGRMCSDVEMTEKEIERTVMATSRAEYVASETLKQHMSPRESSASRAEPSSSAARGEEGVVVPRETMQHLLSMGFTYLQVVEAYSVCGDNVECMIDHMTGTNSSPSK